MIISVEIWNLESHKHSRFEFGPALNLLCGPSDSGKSSVLRAICLAAYNRWNDDMLRIGAKTARVVVTTDRGTVDVERGQNVHKWVVSWMEEGQARCETYTKIGRGNVPEKATWVMGMPKIEVAGTESLPNTMYQLDKPFLLSEFEGKACSSSVVAQVVDEVSGLIGLENLQREINLDLTRNKRRATELEERETGLHKKKADLSATDHLPKQAAQARKDLNNINRYIARLRETESMKASIANLLAMIQASAAHCQVLPVLKEQETLLAEVFSWNTRLQQTQQLQQQIEALRKEIDATASEPCGLDRAQEDLGWCVVNLPRLSTLMHIYDSVRSCQDDMMSANRSISGYNTDVTTLKSVLKREIGDNCPLCGSPTSSAPGLACLQEDNE